MNPITELSKSHMESCRTSPDSLDPSVVRVLQQDSGFFKPDVTLVRHHGQLVVRKDYGRYRRSPLAPLARWLVSHEVAILNQLADWPRSPNVVEHQTPYHFYMQYLPGDKFKTAVKQGHAIEMADLLQMVGELHRRNICHNDLRGANILVSPDSQLHLIDFATAVAVPSWMKWVRTKMRCMDLGSVLKLKKQLSDKPYTPREQRLMSGRGWYRVMRYMWKQQVLRLLRLRG